MTHAGDPTLLASRFPAFHLHGERFIEPWSGLAMIGVGGEWLGETGQPVEVEIRYDGQPCQRVAVRGEPDDTSTGAPRYRYRFGTQAPREPGVTAVEVVALTGSGEVLLARGRVDDFRDRETAPPGGNDIGATGFLGRAWRCLWSGTIFSPSGWVARLGRGWEQVRNLPLRVRNKLLARAHRPRSPHDAYQASTALSPVERDRLADEGRRFDHRPVISILLPVYEIDPVWLGKAVDSVRGQLYENWELCVADDASTNPALARYLDGLTGDPRIKVTRRSVNGHICAATNSAADLATGEFVALLDHDDCLDPAALLEIVRVLQDHPDADLIYTDEDKIDAAGRRYDPQFKPGWSPDMLLAYNYVNHFTCVRRSVFEGVGRFRPGYEGAQDQDLLLRVACRTSRVHHIPQILYHWRSLPSSTATAAGVKPFVHTSSVRALQDHLGRLGVTGTTVYVPPFARDLGLPINLLDWPDDGPSVAVVVAVRGPVTEALCGWFRRIREKTAYRQMRIVLLEASFPGEPFRDDHACSTRLPSFVTRLDLGGADPAAPPALLYNRAATWLPDEWILFLTPGLEPADPRWLSRLVGYSSLPGVGATGARICAADGTVIQAGVVLGMCDGTAPAYAFHGLPATAVSYYFQAEIARDCSAVSAACFLTRRRTFIDRGGFDVSSYGSTMFDVDYCLRLRRAGLRSVIVGSAELIGPGGTDRRDDPLELLTFKDRNGRVRDRWYNPNLSARHSYRPLAGRPATRNVEGWRAVRALIGTHNLNRAEGAPLVLADITTGLARCGRLNPVVVSPLAGPAADLYRAAGIAVEPVVSAVSPRFSDGQWTTAEYRQAQSNLAGLIRRTRPEVVIANTLCTFPLVEAAAAAGIPSVWILHEAYAARHRARVFSPYARARCEAAFALATHVVPVSHETAGCYRELDLRSVTRVIHNGTPGIPSAGHHWLPRLRRDGERLGILTVGSVCERKGQHVLVEAAALLHRQRDDFEVKLVGVRDGLPYATYVANLVRRRKLGAVVTLVPETDRVEPYYLGADVYVCTSFMESFSSCILEAEAYGLPIISTDCGGVSEQVVWDANAVRCPPGDPAALAAALGRLLDDAMIRHQMGQRSRALFENHRDRDEMLDDYQRLILDAALRGPYGRDTRRTRPAPVPLPKKAKRRAA